VIKVSGGTSLAQLIHIASDWCFDLQHRFKGGYGYQGLVSEKGMSFLRRQLCHVSAATALA